MTPPRYLREWEKLAGSDPYFAVLTDDGYRAKNLTAEALDRFFASGSQYVAFVLEQITARLDSGFAPHRVLDFGCGVGRLILAFGKSFEEVTGVDASAAMLAEARANCARSGLRNVQLLTLSEFLQRTGWSFDLVNAYIVFQHVPVEEGHHLLARLLESVRQGGVAALHFVFRSPSPWWRRALARAGGRIPGVHGLANLARGKAFGTPHMQMNPYDLNRLFLELQNSGFGHVDLRFTDHGGFRGVLLLAQRSLHPVP